jgi:hypothetical protein
VPSQPHGPEHGPEGSARVHSSPIAGFVNRRKLARLGAFL